MPHRRRAHAHAPDLSSVPPTLPPPPVDQQQPFQAQVLPPPFQLPHIHPLARAGHPPVGGQYHNAGLVGMNAPQAYAQAYGPPFYPPIYPPVQYPPFIPGPGGPGQLPPWDYTHYPMDHRLTAPVPRPAATLADNNRVRLGEPVVEEEQLEQESGGGTIATASTPHQTVQTGKTYPNKLLGEWVWEFPVDVSDGDVKRTFIAHSAMKWLDFQERAKSHFSNDVRMGYRFTTPREPQELKELSCESEWDATMGKLHAKAKSARLHKVGLELREMHNKASAPKTAKSKGKGKRRRSDDIPPEPLPEIRHQNKCLLELQKHLLCQMHSGIGMRTYCWVEVAGEGTSGGHREVDHEEMTLWAKHIALGKMTKYLPPNVKKFNRPPTKKPKVHTMPEVHIAVNITPTPGAGGASAMQGSYVVSDSPIVHPLSASAPGPLVPAGVSNNAAQTKPPIAPATSALLPLHGPQKGFSPLLVNLDCKLAERVPSVHELLRLMDREDPRNDLKYVDALSDLQDLGVKDVMDVYSLGVAHLATFFSMDMDRAHRLHKFAQDKILTPLGLMKTRQSKEPSVEEVVAPTQVDVQDWQQATQDDMEEDSGWLIKQESYEVILDWLEGVRGCKEGMVEEEKDELDELESDGDVSQEG